MKLLVLIALALAVADVALAQTPAYVSYEGARLYADADFLSQIIDTLSLGDSAMVLERKNRFARVQVDSSIGWILAVNLSDARPRGITTAKRDSVARSPARSRPRNDAAQSNDAPSSNDATSAQCAGVTKSGKQCSRKAKEGSSYCWQHAK
jgi:hypothetical protein